MAFVAKAAAGDSPACHNAFFHSSAANANANANANDFCDTLPAALRDEHAAIGSLPAVSREELDRVDEAIAAKQSEVDDVQSYTERYVFCYTIVLPSFLVCGSLCLSLSLDLLVHVCIL